MKTTKQDLNRAVLEANRLLDALGSKKLLSVGYRYGYVALDVERNTPEKGILDTLIAGLSMKDALALLKMAGHVLAWVAESRL